MANKLTEEEFQRYFTPPMRLIGEDEESSGINIRGFVLEVLKNEEIKINIKELEIPYVYIDSKNKYEHILLSYGIEDTFIVIITNKNEIIGYHHLKLREKYGIENN